MERKQILTVAIAGMLVAVVAVGVWWFYDTEEGNDSGEGVLLSFDEYNLQFVTLGKRGLTAAEAHPVAMGKINPGTLSSGTLGAVENWTTLWTFSHGGSDWEEVTGKWEELFLKDFKYVSFSKEYAKPVVVKDTAGELIFSMMGSKDRIVVMSSSIKDILVALGETDKIVGADSVSHRELGSSDVANVGSYGTANFSTILRAEPDLVIVDRNWTDESIEKQLRDVGIPVLKIESRNSQSSIMDNIENIMDNVMNIGYATGTAATAKDITVKMQNIIDGLDGLLTGSPSVLIVTSPMGDDGGFTGEISVYGTSTPQSDLLELIGGNNVVSAPNYPRVDKGDFLRDYGTEAQIVILIYMAGTVSASDSVKTFKEDPMFELMDAAINNKVFAIDGLAASALNRSSPDIVYGMAMLYVILEHGIDFGDDFKDVLMNYEEIRLIIEGA